MSIQTRLPTLSGMALVIALTAVALAPAAGAQSLPVSMSPALASVAPDPPVVTLPAALDAKTQYQGQVSCDRRTQPGVTAFAALMKAHYKIGVAGANRTCLAVVSEHYDGRALDWMLNINNAEQKAVADSVVAWLSADSGAMARRFGLSYIIWNRKVFKLYRADAGWTAYTGAVPHTDHVHFTFSWDGAMKRTSWWTGKATTAVDVGPCRVYAGEFAPLYTGIRTAACPTNLPAAPSSPYAVYVFGQRDAQIEVAQRLLGVPVGVFGVATYDALLQWQARAGVPITGVLDKATWAKLVPSTPVTPPPPVVTPPPPVVTPPPPVVTPPPPVVTPPPPVVTPPPPVVTPPPVLAPAPPPVTPPPPAVSPWAVTAYTPYKAVVLQQGSKGPAVAVLQRGLTVTADGAFGPKTRVALVAFQKAQGIAGSGSVTRGVWDRLETRDHPLIAYRGVAVSQGSKGPVVAAIQRAIRVSADGNFGPMTAAAVKAVQTRAKLTATGVVSAWTWVAIETQSVG